MSEQISYFGISPIGEAFLLSDAVSFNACAAYPRQVKRTFSFCDEHGRCRILIDGGELGRESFQADTLPMQDALVKYTLGQNLPKNITAAALDCLSYHLRKSGLICVTFSY